MSILKRIIAILLMLAAGVLTVLQNFVWIPKGIDQVVDVAAAKDGCSLVQHIEDHEIVFDLIDAGGTIRKQFQIKQTEKQETSVIADFVIDQNNRVYLIRDYHDAKSGRFLRQELEVYEMERTFPSRVSAYTLENEEKIRYRWLSSSGVLVMMGTNQKEEILQRLAFDPEMLAVQGPMTPKGERIYQLHAKEGIYEAVPASSDVVYTTKSGKVFKVNESGLPQEIYPARILQTLMYPMFINAIDAEHVMIGEQESGDISLLELQSGKTEMLMGGTERFSGVSDYSACHVLRLSAIDTDHYTAVVRNQETGYYDLIVNQEGNFQIVTQIVPGVLHVVLSVLGSFLFWSVLFYLGYAIFFGMVQQIKNSRTILLKLAFSAIPLLILSFVLFGLFSYSFYSKSVETSFEKQVEDEGNLLTALFGTDSFNEIEFPYDYTKDGYTYLKQQMSTREVYTRTAYYENEKLYTGVVQDLPCFYSLDILLNRDAVNLYQKAAYTGVAQKGMIHDQLGSRMTCITPIGGPVGGTVYLLETGIYEANMDAYSQQYLTRYIWVAAIFILVISILLTLVFLRVLDPLADMKKVLEEFSKGNRKARMESETKDELSDIARVFNQMAGDIDVQLYHLKSVSNAYYRFIPQRNFSLLGKDNMGDLQLGDHVQGYYNILCAELSIRSDRLPKGAEKELVNTFFNILNETADRYEATLLEDGVNLCSLKIICPEGGESGVNIALSALAQIDSYNASVELQKRMEVTFLLHRTDVYYGICGDEERYIPTMISVELEDIAREMPRLRQFSSRLLVSEPAYQTIEESNYFSRYIGSLEDSRFQNLGLYDFYDENAPEIIRLINQTRSTFDKAIELYRQKRFYDAKNLFAIVLRENQYDNVARYYIFKCEKQL